MRLALNSNPRQVAMQSNALGWWYRVLHLALTRDLPDLTTRQLALLLHVALVRQSHTVRGLAQALQISKPAVTRALDRLGAAGYLVRQRDPLDRRSVLVSLTPDGRAFLGELEMLVQDAEGAPATDEAETRKTALHI